MNEYSVDREECEITYLFTVIQTIIKIYGKFFAIEWNEGRLEPIEHEYPCQPYPVEPVEKTITVWLPVIDSTNEEADTDK